MKSEFGVDPFFPSKKNDNNPLWIPSSSFGLILGISDRPAIRSLVKAVKERENFPKKHSLKNKPSPVRRLI